ncbi:hypothetical protein HFO16_17990 [Rhizobium laguerreae]|nr:hypothetical protein [Rhizobium laguerreae]
MAAAGGHHPPPWPDRLQHHQLHFRSGPCCCHAARVGSPWRARKAQRRPARRELAQLVRRVHGGGANRQAAATLKNSASVRFRVLIDGQPPVAAHGIDIDEKGEGTVTEQRLYQLIRQPYPIVDRQFEIEFLDSDVQVFAFTFG